MKLLRWVPGTHAWRVRKLMKNGRSSGHESQGARDRAFRQRRRGA